MTIDPKRRVLLGGILASATPAAALAKAARLCLRDPAISDLAAPLTIDTHTHFFNGSDLQVREFMSQTTVGPDSELYPFVQAMTGVLQRLAWNAAPDAARERVALARYAQQLKQCAGQDEWRSVTTRSFDDGYKLGRHHLKLTAQILRRRSDAPEVLGPKDAETGLGAAIDALPPTLEEFESDSKPLILQTQPTLAGYLRFVLHHFNFRHVNAIDYLTTYSPNGPRKIDLAVASLVDFDYWLTKGRGTPTSLGEQVALMGEISVLLGGRVHGFVPFCPFREMMTQDRYGVGNSMRLVKRAVEQHGFIGVKLYPPMGFAAMGNTGKSLWNGKRTLDRAAWDRGFGAKLDSALSRLYRYCEEIDLPIMAHSNDSNGPYENFRQLAGSEYWKQAIEKFPGLRVSFGHFGDSDIEDRNGDDALPFLRLMTQGANTAGRNVFADSGFFAGVMVDQGNMRDTLLALYGAANGNMPERLMYGSDWHMILTQENVKNYLENFIELMNRVEENAPTRSVRQTSLSDAFFGRNAVEFLGLGANRGNRGRLERFYANNAVPQPDWMRKVG